MLVQVISEGANIDIWKELPGIGVSTAFRLDFAFSIKAASHSVRVWQPIASTKLEIYTAVYINIWQSVVNRDVSASGQDINILENDVSVHI